ncbi:glycosyl transferase [Serinicoccus sp. CNJ-927]|uniref:glycosyltransferase family 2 protein n=1 Tax=Serinicoccus sp. CNJ-927 TaxID=1904970 RepID=UPI000962762C|nr:glycosyltransferase [Serinicoccus sp. CNJ-927]OLT43414.1 glycosyl transferase [Serinicoccus sp. CNJ-927]
MTGGTSSGRPSFGVVVLTQGRRPEELARGLKSLQRQQGVELDVVVVGNAWNPTGLPNEVKTLALPTNIGIPAGRNAGVPHVDGEFLFFLDDDAWLIDDDVLLRTAGYLREHPDVGLVQPLIEDPEVSDGAHPGRWIPRLGARQRHTEADVFSVVEMTVAMRREAFEATGGWPGIFFYAHEGIELAWRVWAAGYRVRYVPSLRTGHPVVDPRRHSDYFFKNARNRVWLARRNLPRPLAVAYVGSWTGIQLVRWAAQRDGLASWWSGWVHGWRSDPFEPGEDRTRLTWRAVARMARHGRFLIV